MIVNIEQTERHSIAVRQSRGNAKCEDQIFDAAIDNRHGETSADL